MPRPERKSNATTKIFADRLSDLVEEKKKSGLSQKEIAAEIGVSSGTLSEWCNDNKTPMIDALPKLASYFCVSTDWLTGCSHERSRSESTQKIHHETGLSASVINKLKIDKITDTNEYIQFLNCMIESPSFSDMAKIAALYQQIQADSTISINMDHISNGLGVSLRNDVFMKTILTEYFFKVIDGK